MPAHQLFGKNTTLTGGPAPVRACLETALGQVLAGVIDPDAPVVAPRVGQAAAEES